MTTTQANGVTLGVEHFGDSAAVAAALARRTGPGRLAVPALVVHGRHDPFFPVGNGEALAREIPDAVSGDVAAATTQGTASATSCETRARRWRWPRSACA